MAWVTLDLRVLDNDEVELTVRNSTGPALVEQDVGEVSGLGSQLIAAFVMQLGGVNTSGPTDDNAYQVRVTFTRADFTTEQDAPDAA
jgi:two-component sensor histidine kinase